MAQTSGIAPVLSDQVRKTIYDFMQQGFDELDPIHKKLFGLISTTHKFERLQSIAPLGAMPPKGEGGDFTFDQIQQAYSKDLTPAEYGFGFLWTKTAEEDDEYGVLAQKAKFLGMSARILQETLAATVINNGHAGSGTTTADGVTLFSTAHLLKRGGTAKNALTTAADLSFASMAQMRADMRTNTKLENGQLVKPSKDLYLVCHPDNEMYAHIIVNSVLRPGSADNDTNAIKDLLSVSVLPWEYQTDTDAWALIAKKTSSHGLKRVSRIPPTPSAEDVDSKTGNRLVTIRMREVFDAFDWRNTAGTPGA